MIHTRMATCGKKTVDEAHPFHIKRNGRSVLWGMHNGVIHNARESAEKNDRPYSVDSKELFEVLADRNYEAFKNFTGYGTIVWIDAQYPQRITMARMSHSADLAIATIVGGGVMWASTRDILENAVKLSKLEIDSIWVDAGIEVGKPYWTEGGKLWYDKEIEHYKINGYSFGRQSYSNYHGY